ncbi:HAD family hydrolase [Paenibacillus oenotherae]|uniref:HAD family hydrolase n=1 Tax=Paenibacillus oenotherae TaxID=1435645 RepID=A0ABS7D464_9BACL|nr:HAD family hydrolase [Paenibacillus oenotherae]MBW7474722.1 HAD family hydrolase [Paenibacillus oenotherae]
MIKAVLFDLDLTLLNRDASVKQFVDSQYERLHTCLSHIPREQYISRFVELDNRGYVWKDRVYKQIIDEFSIHGLTWEELLDDYVGEFHRSCLPYPGLIEMLEELKKEQLLLGLITNAHGDFQYRNIQALGIEDYFSVLLISGWEGIKKPDPAIFLSALNKLGVMAEESVYIGDHPINDVQAARNVGMKGIWKRDSQWETPDEADGIVDELSEVLPLIRAFKSGNRTDCGTTCQSF